MGWSRAFGTTKPIRSASTPTVDHGRKAPLLVVVAIGCGAVIEIARGIAPPRALVAVAATTVIALGLQAAFISDDLARHPSEAVREAAKLASRRPAPPPIIVHTSRLWPFRCYLRHTTRYVGVTSARSLICGLLPYGAVFVYYPYHAKAAGTDCLRSRGAQLHRLLQRGRDGYVDVWLIPPDPRPVVDLGTRPAMLRLPETAVEREPATRLPASTP